MRAQQAVALEQLASLDRQLATEPGAVASSLELERDQTYATLRETAASMTELQSASQLENRAELVKPATTPDAPMSPRSGLNLVLGLVLGTAAGLSLALALESRRAAQSVDQLIEALGIGPVLAHLQRQPDTATSGSAARGASDSLRALRAVLLARAEQSLGDRPLRLVGIATADDPGTSHHTLALAALLARSGRRVLFLDADTVIASDTSAGAKGATPFANVDLSDFTSDGSAAPRTSLTEVEPRLFGLSLGASRPELVDSIDATRLERLVRRLAGNDLDVIASATMSPVALELAAALGQVLLLVTPGSLAEEETQRAVGNLQRVGAEFVGSAILGCDPGADGRRKALRT